MSHRYVKHPMYVGKSLTIHRGRRDKLVGDLEVLEGREWEKFVALGLLVPDPNDKPEEPKAAPRKPVPEPKAPEPVKDLEPIKEPERAPEPPPEPSPEPAKDEVSVSRSPANKVSFPGAKKKGKKGKK